MLSRSRVIARASFRFFRHLTHCKHQLHRTQQIHLHPSPLPSSHQLHTGSFLTDRRTKKKKNEKMSSDIIMTNSNQGDLAAADAASASASAPSSSQPKPPPSSNSQGPAPTPTQMNREETFNIISWNCNGLRSVSMKPNTPLSSLFTSYTADIFCFQETKMSAFSDITDAHTVPGFDAFYSFSRQRKGWSGVATYVRQGCTVSAVEDLQDIRTDGEGRVLLTDHGRFILLNIYFPNAGRGPERLEYKLKFYSAIESYVRNLITTHHRHVIIVGDVNTAHEDMDIWNPTAFANSSGFLPQERAWLDAMVKKGVSKGKVEDERRLKARNSNEVNEESKEEFDSDFMHQLIPDPPAATAAASSSSIPDSSANLTAASSSSVSLPSPPPAASPSPLFIDSYRYFHPYQRNVYSFWDMRTMKREVGQGWRIDMMMVDESLMLECGADAELHMRQRGSDHCPTSLHFHLPPPVAVAPAAAIADSSSSVASSSFSATAASRLSRIDSFLQLSPFPHPVPVSSVMLKIPTKLQRQGSLQTFFGKSASTAATAVPAAAASIQIEPPPPMPTKTSNKQNGGEVKKRKLDENSLHDHESSNPLDHIAEPPSSLSSVSPIKSGGRAASTTPFGASPTKSAPSQPAQKKSKLNSAAALNKTKGQINITDLFATKKS